jgi:hypothetical protein
METSLRKKIEQRAYELFLARGGQHGYHIQDWNQAEKEALADLEKNSQKPGVQKDTNTESEKTVQPKSVPPATSTVVKKRGVKKKTA